MRDIIILFLFFFSIGFAQTTPIDSLKRNLPTLHGIDRYQALYILSDELEDTYPKEALQYALEAIQLADTLGIQDSVSILYATAGYCYTLLGEFANGLHYAFRALDSATYSGIQTQIATAHSTLGIIHVYVGQYSTALRHHQESLRIREQLGMNEQAIRTLNNIGVVYHNIGNYAKAIEFYQEVMRRRGKTVDTLAAIRFYHNVGFAEYMRGNIDTSQVYLDKALALAKNVNYISGIAYSYYNLGLLSIHRGRLHDALNELNASLKHYESLGQKHGALQVLNAIGLAQYKLKDYPTAIRTLLRSEQLAKSIRSPEELKSSYETLYKVYDVVGPLEKAYRYYQLYSEAKDSLVNSRERNEIAELTVNLQNARSRQEIQELKAQKHIDEANIEKQNFRSILLVGGLFVLVFIVALLYMYIRNMKKNRKELESNFAKMEGLNKELQDRLNEIKTLSGLLPICAHCKKIRDDEGYWQQLEGFISHHTEAKFSHGICPDCREKYFPDV
jgi:tetratricopeptide (TPR) repeat protein